MTNFTGLWTPFECECTRAYVASYRYGWIDPSLTLSRGFTALHAATPTVFGEKSDSAISRLLRQSILIKSEILSGYCRATLVLSIVEQHTNFRSLEALFLRTSNRLRADFALTHQDIYQSIGQGRSQSSSANRGRPAVKALQSGSRWSPDA